MFREDNSQRGKEISAVSKNLWGVVLAGGEGTRLRNLAMRLYGYHRPKQYCTITGTQSLIKHTINRASKIIPNRKILTVVNSNHAGYYKEELKNQPEETIVIQPCPRETSAGILLPVTKIFKSDPDSTVAIFPSDHFVLEEDKFINYIKEACIFVERNPDLIVLGGIRPEKNEPGMGWIERGEKIHSINNLNFHRIQKFWEKPDLAASTSLFTNECLINTFIMIGKSKTIIEQMKRILPQLITAFEPIYAKMGTPSERIIIERFFQTVPQINFSKDFLEKICNRLVTLELSDIYWSDWGEEQRVISDLERFNLTFPQSSIFNINAIKIPHTFSRHKEKGTFPLPGLY